METIIKTRPDLHSKEFDRNRRKTECKRIVNNYFACKNITASNTCNRGTNGMMALYFQIV